MRDVKTDKIRLAMSFFETIFLKDRSGRPKLVANKFLTNRFWLEASKDPFCTPLGYRVCQQLSIQLQSKEKELINNRYQTLRTTPTTAALCSSRTLLYPQ